MKIAILTSGILPVPAVKGGAVENLMDFYLAYNDKHRLHDITVYSVWHPDVAQHPAQQSEVNHYIYLRVDTLWAKLKKRLFKWTHSKGYYHYTIEYYLDWALRQINRQQFDVVITENRPGYALQLMRQGHQQVVCHQENDYVNVTTPQHRQIYDSTALFINTSDYITRRVRTISDTDTKCVTVLNGIDVERFYQACPLPRSAAGLHDEDFVLVFSGMLVEEKGILELIQAIKTLSIPHLKLLIIGASFYGQDMKKSPFVKRLEDESESVKDQVVFTGFVPYEQIPSYLKMADVAVVPSMWEEPFGLTVAEAMAAGLPLITTRSGGIPEICEGVAEIVDRENVVAHLADAIKGLYEDTARRRTMAEAALERSKLFSKEAFARNYFHALENVRVKNEE